MEVEDYTTCGGPGSLLEPWHVRHPLAGHHRAGEVAE